MKVLMINDHTERIGGTEKYIELITKELEKKGITILKVSYGNKRKETSEELILQEPKNLFTKYYRKSFSSKKNILRIKKFIEKTSPDVIHIHNINIDPLSILRAVRGKNVVQTTHDYSLLCPESWNTHSNMEECPTGIKIKCWTKHRRSKWPFYLVSIYSFIKKRKETRTAVKKFICPSFTIKKYMEKNRYEKTHLLPYPLTNKKTGKKNPGKNRIIYIGSLEEHKGIIILINEMAEVTNKNPDVKLTIIGTGTKYNLVKKRIEKLGLDQAITLKGYTENTDEEIRKNVAVIAPSIWMEQYGLAVMEAMINKRAVIGSNKGNIPKLIENGKTGLLFIPEKKGELAKKIMYVLNNPDRAINMGLEGYRKIKYHDTAKKHTKKLLEIYLKEK